MQLSKKKIEKARRLYTFRYQLGFKKYQAISELKEFGIYIDPNSDLDGITINKIYACVIERIVSKYGLDGDD